MDGRALPFTVEISRNRGRLILSRPLKVGPVRVNRLEVGIPHLRLPADLGAGSLAFRSHLTDLELMGLTLSGAELVSDASAAGLDWLIRVEFKEDSLEVMMRGAVGQAPVSFISRWRMLPAERGGVLLLLMDVISTGFSRVHWRRYVEERLLSLERWLPVERSDSGILVFLLPGLLDRIFLASGWKVPFSQVEVAALGTRGGNLVIELAPGETIDELQRFDEEVNDLARRDADALTRLDKLRIHQDVEDAIARADTAAALRMLHEARQDPDEWDAFLQEHLLIIQATEPGLHDRLLSETERLIADGECELTALATRLTVFTYRRDRASAARAGMELASALVSRRRGSAAAFLLWELLTFLKEDPDQREAFLRAALELVPDDPGLLAARAEYFGPEGTVGELLASLPYVSSQAQREGLLASAVEGLLGRERYLDVIDLWDTSGLDTPLPALPLARTIHLAADLGDQAAMARIASLLIARGAAPLLERPAAELLLSSILESGSEEELMRLTARLGSVVEWGSRTATAILRRLEDGVAPEQCLELMGGFDRPQGLFPRYREQWINLHFRLLLRCRRFSEAWRSLDHPNEAGVRVWLDEDSLALLELMARDGDEQDRAVSELVRWVEGAPPGAQRAEVAGRLGRILLQDLGSGARSLEYLMIAYREGAEGGTCWLPELEKALESTGRLSEWVEVLRDEVRKEGIHPPVRIGELYLRMARILGEGLERWSEAEVAARRSRTLLPGKQEPSLLLEQALARLGDWDALSRHLRERTGERVSSGEGVKAALAWGVLDGVVRKDPAGAREARARLKALNSSPEVLRILDELLVGSFAGREALALLPWYLQGVADAELPSPVVVEDPPSPPEPEDGPSQLDLACDEAIKLADLGDVEGAVALLRAVIEDEPRHSAALDLLAVLSGV